MLKEFAHRLAHQGRETKAIRVQKPDDALGVAPGDLVVFEAGNAWIDKPTWFVVRKWKDGKPIYSFALLSRTSDVFEDDVRGRILFIIRKAEDEKKN